VEQLKAKSEIMTLRGGWVWKMEFLLMFGILGFARCLKVDFVSPRVSLFAIYWLCQ